MAHSGKALVDPHLVFSKISLTPGMRVADLGCGRTGHFVFPAAKVVGERGIVYAVEIVKNILENIKSRVRSEGFDNVQAIWSDIEAVGKTPIPAGSLQACFLVNVLFLVKNKSDALKEAVRLLEPGGSLVIVDWSRKLGLLGPAPEMMLNPESTVEIAKNLGLNLTQNFPMGDYHFCLIFNKS